MMRIGHHFWYAKRMTQTFAELGIPFPLFAAPISEATTYIGMFDCSFCGNKGVHCFGSSHHCAACYECFRDGRNASGKQTSIGFVSMPLAKEGLTDAAGMTAKQLEHLGFSSIPHRAAPELHDWRHACAPAEQLVDLACTPDFRTLQGSNWLFCCKCPMVYVGVWKEREFELYAGARDPATVFNEIMVDIPDSDFVWPPQAPLAGCGGPYVFKCAVCGTIKGNHDMW